MIALTVNGTRREVAADPFAPLSDTLREGLGLTGTKEGCNAGDCGACTVLMDGQAIRACVTPIEAVAAGKITTIEGLGGQHPLQQAWVKHDVPQCGYCQSGQIMSAAALLSANAKPTDADIDAAMDGNICRCGTYQRVRAAIKDAATMPANAPAAAPAPAKA